MRCLLDFERNRSQRQGSEFVSREVEFMRWFPVAFLTNGAVIVSKWTDNACVMSPHA